MTQYDMTDVEQAGLVKFDFLGLRTLTIIDQAVKSINARRGESGESPIDINALNLEDPEIYQDLKEAKTTAVFQLESRGMKDLMKRVAPSRFADVVAWWHCFDLGRFSLPMILFVENMGWMKWIICIHRYSTCWLTLTGCSTKNRSCKLRRS